MEYRNKDVQEFMQILEDFKKISYDLYTKWDTLTKEDSDDAATEYPFTEDFAEVYYKIDNWYWVLEKKFLKKLNYEEFYPAPTVKELIEILSNFDQYKYVELRSIYAPDTMLNVIKRVSYPTDSSNSPIIYGTF